MVLKRVEIYNNKLILFLNSELVQIFLLTMISISSPLFIKSPQILVGSIVNFVLFYSAKRFGFKKSLPTIILPSLIAYSCNILFKGATPFLLYFIPVIVIGNSIYVLLSRYIKNSIVSVILSSISKSILLYIFAFVFVNELGLPNIFLTTMGIIQLYTGLIGGGLGYMFNDLTNRKNE